MSFTVGVGIVTCNSTAILRGIIERARAFTQTPDAAFEIADDGSPDGTLERPREMQVPSIGGVNMGLARNKNPALFRLWHVPGRDTVIFPEDDAWQAKRIAAAQRWGSDDDMRQVWAETKQFMCAGVERLRLMPEPDRDPSANGLESGSFRILYCQT